MLRFNALIWPAVSSSVSLILIHLVPSKTLWSNLGKLALAQTNRRLWDSTDIFSFFFGFFSRPQCSLSVLACAWGRTLGFVLLHACVQTHWEGGHGHKKRKGKTFVTWQHEWYSAHTNSGHVWKMEHMSNFCWRCENCNALNEKQTTLEQ